MQKHGSNVGIHLTKDSIRYVNRIKAGVYGTDAGVYELEPLRLMYVIYLL